MSTIQEAADTFKMFASGFMKTVSETVKESSSEVVDYIQEQLYSGLDGWEQPLRPTYLDDPFFEDKEASGGWYKRAAAYARWKKAITRPAASYLGLPARDANTPNLIITGEFYMSIVAIPYNDGLRIGTRGTPMGADIERKYGSDIFKVGDRAKAYFLRWVVLPRLMEYYSTSGL